MASFDQRTFQAITERTICAKFEASRLMVVTHISDMYTVYTILKKKRSDMFWDDFFLVPSLDIVVMEV